MPEKTLKLVKERCREDITYVAHGTSSGASLDRIRTCLRILASTPRYLHMAE